MSRLSFAAHDLRSGQHLGRLPFVGSCEELLNGAGLLVGTVDLRIATRTGLRMAQAYIDATTPRRTVIWVSSDSQLLDGYIIWSRGLTPKGRKLMLHGASIFSYFFRRRLRVTRPYTNVDQTAIAGDLLTWAQQQPGGNIGVTIAPTPSGRLRNRHPLAYDYEAKIVGTLVQQLAAVRDGFDFAVESAYVDDQPTATFRTYYPRRGRAADASGIVFTLGGNALDLDYLEDESDRPNTVLGIGAGEDITQLATPAVDASELDAGYPLLEASYIRKNIYEEDTLEANTQADLWQRQDSERMTLELDANHKVAPLGSWIVGDDARVIVPAGRHPRFPAGYDRAMRIIGRRITTNVDRSIAKVSVTMGRARG